MVNTELILRRIREQGKNQKDLAELLGIKQSSVSLKINNKRPFFVDEALKLAEYLGIDDSQFSIYFFANEVA